MNRIERRRECRRCGGSVRPYYSPGERQPELRCLSCGRAPALARNRYAVAARQQQLAPRREAVRALRQQGLSGMDIARRLQLTPAKVQNDLQALGLSVGHQKISDATIRQIKVMALDGVSVRQIAIGLGVHPMTVRRHLAKLNRPTGQAIKRDKALRLLAVGRPAMTYQAIADLVGMSHTNVWRLADKHGLHAGAPTTPQAATGRPQGLARPNAPGGGALCTLNGHSGSVVGCSWTLCQGTGPLAATPQAHSAKPDPYRVNYSIVRWDRVFLTVLSMLTPAATQQ